MAARASTDGSDGEYWLGGSELSPLRMLMNFTPGLRLVVREIKRNRGASPDPEHGTSPGPES